MNDRKEALRHYFHAVVQDLIARGTLRRQRGQSLEDILRKESTIVLRGIQADFVEIGRDIGIGFLNGASRMLGNFVQYHADNLMGEVSQALGNLFRK